MTGGVALKRLDGFDPMVDGSSFSSWRPSPGQGRIKVWAGGDPEISGRATSPVSFPVPLAGTRAARALRYNRCAARRVGGTDRKRSVAPRAGRGCRRLRQGISALAGDVWRRSGGLWAPIRCPDAQKRAVLSAGGSQPGFLDFSAEFWRKSGVRSRIQMPRS
jgi:hypothetical protein